MDKTPRILYYPNFNLSDLQGIKHSLLLCDRISVIAPTMTPHYQVPKTFADIVIQKPANITPYGTDISPSGALEGMLEECRLDDGSSAVELIDDYEIAHSHAREITLAMRQDLKDPDIDLWEKRWRARYPDLEPSWYISSPYFTDFLGLNVNDPAVRTTYHLERIRDEQLGELVKVPFRIGMSLGVSEALWAAIDKECSLFTLDRTSADYLMLRLQRGFSHLPDNSQLLHELKIDRNLAEGFAASSFGAWTLGFAMPELFTRIPQLALADVMNIRRQADTADALAEFRGGIMKIVTEEKLWRAKDFQEFQEKAEDVSEKILTPAYEALGHGKFDIRDVVTAFDPASAAKNFIKAGPKLFFTSATGASVGGAIALVGGASLVPAALIGLAAGLVADAVAEYIMNQQDRLKQFHNAQFLTYSVQLRDTLR